MATVRGYSSSSEDERKSGSKLVDFGRVSCGSGLIANPEVDEQDEVVEGSPGAGDDGNVIRNVGGTFERRYLEPTLFKVRARGSRKRAVQARQEAREIKKKRRKGANAEDDEFLGPWAGYTDSSDVASGFEEDETNNFSDDEVEVEESEDDEDAKITTRLFIDEADNGGNSLMNVPRALNVDLTKDPGTQECFAPKKVVGVVEAHAKGINKLELFPKTGHLLLSCGNDGSIKLWDFYHKRELIRGYYGHTHSVKDVVFNSTGREFLSCGYDKKAILWDTESGTIKKSVKLKSIPNVIKFNPKNESEFIVGLANHRIEHYDLNSLDYTRPFQVYDHHLGSINSLTVIEDNKRFMSTADDKTVRFWDWQINIPIKFISDPSQHSMPSAVVYPGGKHIALQSMDNSIQVIQGHGKFRFNKNKSFSGHNVAGYGIQINISPDGKVLMSGDSKGYAYFWDWKTCRLVRRIKLSDRPIFCVVPHPQETSKTVLGGLDGKIYFCD